MKPLTLAATALTLVVTGPAVAMAFSFSLPLLTFPAPPTPDVTQSCSGATAALVETCSMPTK
ncbi:hypothetical protein [Yoonia sp.]|uniref:hypothetical protein n=1 Tax=Yoonia sp. TaxID=2212373 RepID=UPI003A4E2753